jgi:hypothetical protein
MQAQSNARSQAQEDFWRTSYEKVLRELPSITPDDEDMKQSPLQRINIFIHGPNKPFSMRVAPSDTVSHLKMKIELFFSLTDDLYYLHYGGRYLVDSQYLCDYDIQDHATLFLCFRSKGGGPQPVLGGLPRCPPMRNCDVDTRVGVVHVPTTASPYQLSLDAHRAASSPQLQAPPPYSSQDVRSASSSMLEDIIHFLNHEYSNFVNHPGHTAMQFLSDGSRE